MQRYSYNTNFEVINKNKVKYITSLFINQIIKELKNGHLITVVVKIGLYEIDFKWLRSISEVQHVDLKNYKDFIKLIVGRWDLYSDKYKSETYNRIIFEYKIFNKDSIKEGFVQKSLNVKNVLNKHSNKFLDNIFLEENLIPKTIDLWNWGNIQFNFKYDQASLKLNKNNKFNFDLYDNHYIAEYLYNNTLCFKLKDIMLDPYNLNSFERIIYNLKGEECYRFVYNDGILVYKSVIEKTDFIDKINKSNKLNYFITMDIETKSNTIDEFQSNMEVICISIHDGNLTNSFYISDFKNKDELIKKALSSLFIKKYNGYVVYFHNFSRFDSVFILSALTDLSNKVIPLKREERIIDIKVRYGTNNKYGISFRDSLLLLPSSLKNLCNSFNVENKKSIFPFDFVNKSDITLNYIGKVPEFEYFNNITIEEYNNYYKNYNNGLLPWNLKVEVIKYCELDVISLYEVILKFQSLIYSTFKLDILKYPTLSSVAFAIYRSNFLDNKANIPIVLGKIYDKIKLAYTGGSVDVYKPFGTNIYRYDVNSLYPSQMLKQDMPVGNPTYFEGDVYKYIDNPFGFFYCKITTPDNLNEPILQLRFKMNNCTRTIAPLGEWEGLYFSEEIKNAIKYGYKFEVINGYIFERKNIFKDYVDYLYKIKSDSNKNSPMYIIAKLLLNGLYGRFGMSPEMSKHLIINSNELDKYIMSSDTITINDQQLLDNGKYLIAYENHEDDFSKILNISVPIASSITAYSRIHMSIFKNNPIFNCFYHHSCFIFISI